MSAPARSCGSSTRSHVRARSAPTPGRRTRGRSTATRACGRRSVPIRWPVWRICRSRRRPRTSTVAIVPATTCSPNRSSRSTSKPVNGSGTTSWSTIRCGTSTTAAPPCSPTSSSTANRSRRWRSRARLAGSTCSTASPVNRSGRLRNVRCRSQRYLARRRRRRSRTSPNRRPTHGRSCGYRKT